MSVLVLPLRVAVLVVVGLLLQRVWACSSVGAGRMGMCASMEGHGSGLENLVVVLVIEEGFLKGQDMALLAVVERQWPAVQAWVEEV